MVLWAEGLIAVQIAFCKAWVLCCAFSIRNYRALTLLFLTLISILTFTPDVLAAYRIVLRNGSSIIVESYKKADGRIQFFKSGGMIEIDSADIAEIKEISEPYREEKPPETEVTFREPAVTVPAVVDEDEIKARLESIQNEKEVLKRESASIMSEIEKLNLQIRREGRLLAIRKKRELEKEKAELEKRVNELNARIEELNREEEELLRKLWRY
ncbi:MAG: hypothetical protein N2257_05510 [Thermodesulfovibrionales bacterium]|nr:hypothetical protein [Thermodesulfovibrionales bacterium]